MKTKAIHPTFLPTIAIIVGNRADERLRPANKLAQEENIIPMCEKGRAKPHANPPEEVDSDIELA